MRALVVYEDCLQEGATEKAQSWILIFISTMPGDNCLNPKIEFYFPPLYAMCRPSLSLLTPSLRSKVSFIPGKVMVAYRIVLHLIICYLNSPFKS